MIQSSIGSHPAFPDDGPTFISNFSHELAALLGVKLTPSTSYHPQTDGQTERVNQEIEAYLQVFVSHQQDDWADWLPLAEFAYNNKVHTATHWTPFELDTSVGGILVRCKTCLQVPDSRV